jgi:rhamnosyltransferase
MAVRISVALATYNGERYIYEQLESIANQSLPPHEIIVSDDCSLDGTGEVVKRFASKTNIPIKLYRNQQNTGFAANFINAASRCSGDVVAFSDQDDIWLEDKLYKCSTLFDDPLTTLVVHSALLADQFMTPTGLLDPTVTKEGPRRITGGRLFGGYAVGCCMVVRRDVVSTLCKFIDKKQLEEYGTETAPFLAHDVLVWALARDMGTVRYIQESLIFRRCHDTNTLGRAELMLTQKWGLWRRLSRALDSKSYMRYMYFAEQYRKASEFLNKLASSIGKSYCPTTATIASFYQERAYWYWERLSMYGESKAGARFLKYIYMVKDGAYKSIASGGLGVRGAIKDAVGVIGGKDC